MVQFCLVFVVTSFLVTCVKTQINFQLPDIGHAAHNVASGAINAGNHVVGGAMHAGGELAQGTLNAGGHVVGGALHAGGELARGTVDAGNHVVGGAMYYGGELAKGTVNAGGQIIGGAMHVGGQFAGGTLHVGSQFVERSEIIKNNLAASAVETAKNLFSGGVYVGEQVVGATGNIAAGGIEIAGNVGRGLGDATHNMINFGVDVANAGINTGLGIINNIPNILFVADELFSMGLNAIIGIPVELLGIILNQVCSIALAGNGLKPKNTPNMNLLNFIFHTESGLVSIPLTESDRLWAHESFNEDWNVTFLITGWKSDVNQPNYAIDALAEAYKIHGQTNFISLDSGRFVDTLYTWSAFNTEDIGESVGIALSHLVQHVPVHKIHLIGHSLGAHICGAAGRSFHRQTNRYIPRITGLDPANPCFNEGEQLAGLQRGDANFIDVIHTNPGFLGKKIPTGDIDFYPNGFTMLQPGCTDIICSHGRAFLFYAETVNNPNNFPGTRCNSIITLKRGACKGNAIPMGLHVPTHAKGNYFFTTNSQSPFGRSRVY